MNINLIYARSINGVIGSNGRLPWSLHEDLQRFKDLTTGCPVVMGYKTWISLPEKVRPLPNRHNVVLTTRDLQSDNSNVVFLSSLGKAFTYLDTLRSATDVWVIGGATVYAQFLPVATKLVVTDVLSYYAGDTWCPEPNPAEWKLTSRSETFISQEGIPYRYSIWTRCTYPRNAEGISSGVKL